MSAPAMQGLVERYLVDRRRLGFDLRKSAYALRSFARYVGAVAHRGPLTVEVMADWARRDSHGSNDPRTWARRLKLLRSFTRWLQQFEPRTEVPDDAIFGRLPERQAPHIFSEQEIRRSARCRAPARSVAWPARRCLRDTVRPDRQLRAAGLRGGRAAQHGRRSRRRGMLTIHRIQVRQVASGADALTAVSRHCVAIDRCVTCRASRRRTRLRSSSAREGDDEACR